MGGNCHGEYRTAQPLQYFTVFHKDSNYAHTNQIISNIYKSAALDFSEMLLYFHFAVRNSFSNVLEVTITGPISDEQKSKDCGIC